MRSTTSPVVSNSPAVSNTHTHWQSVLFGAVVMMLPMQFATFYTVTCPSNSSL